MIRKPLVTIDVPMSLEAQRPHDAGRCGVLVVKRFGRVLKTHTRSWTLPCQGLNARCNSLIDELSQLGPEHPNYLVILSSLQELETERIRRREEGL